MLSQYTSKFIQLLSSEVKLYEWGKDNSPIGYNLTELLEDYISTNRVSLCASKALKRSFEEAGYSSDFGNNLIFIGLKVFQKKIEKRLMCFYQKL